MEKISVIVSCFNEEKTVPLFYEEMERVINTDFNDVDVDFEYIFVNDGSKDNTLQVIKNIRLQDKKVRYISFSRNFGKESAMLARFKSCRRGLHYFNGCRFTRSTKIIKADVWCN